MKTLFGKLMSALRGQGAGQPPAAAASASAFQPRNELERLLMAAATDPSKRIAFHQMLLTADLCAATPSPPAADGFRTAGEGETLQLLHATAPDGTSAAAVFGWEGRIAEVFGPDVGFIKLNGRTLLEMVSAEGAFLNPGLDYGVHWTPADLAVVLGKPVSRTIDKETQVLLGSPAQRPEALIAGLRAALGSNPRIEAAWLALAQWPEAGSSSWYLDVRTTLAREAVHALLADLFATTDFSGRPLDLVVNPPGGEEGAGIQVAPG